MGRVIYNFIAKHSNKTKTKNEKKSKKYDNSKDVVVDTSLLTKQKDDRMDKELEERMNNLDLEDWQKALVREGTYDPENFEEDDSSDEDDYYHEDDE